MRTLLLVLVLLAAGGGAWLVLRSQSDDEGLPEVPSAAGGRPNAPRPEEAPPMEAARVGLGRPEDKRLVADPAAPPWETFVLNLRGEAGSPITGAMLLEAIGERLYVRARTLAELDTLRQHVFEGAEVGAPLPLSTAVAMIERAGYRVGVNDPKLAFRPLSSEEERRKTEEQGDGQR